MLSRLKLSTILPLLSGLLLVFSFAPFNLWPLGIICPALFLYSLKNSTPKKAFYQGLLFGMGLFGFGMYWVYICLSQFGNTPAVVSLFFTGLLVLYLSLFYGFLGYCYKKFFRNNLFNSILVFPSLWILLELLRAKLFTGLPWLLLGYSQTTSWLGNFAPYIGVYGIGFVCLVLAGCIINLKNKKIIFSVILFLVISQFIFSQNHFTHPNKKPIAISLIQGDIAQGDKWNPEQFTNTLSIYKNLTEKHWTSNLIIWPEAAIPLLQKNVIFYLNSLDKQAKLHNTNLLLGLPKEKNNKFYNALLGLGLAKGEYYKRHLVPFGEYVPFEKYLRGVFGFLNLPMSQFSSGAHNQPKIKINNLPIAAYICYEIIFPQLVLKDFPQAQLLVVISDDSWYGHSFAAAQHLQMGQMRARETGRYCLFDTNNGDTAIVNPQGQIINSLKPYTRGVLTGHVSMMVGTTPLIHWGYTPLWILLGMIILWGAIANVFVHGRDLHPQHP